MQSTDAIASPHYTIRTESGKTLQMSQEEKSQLVRKTMKRAKDLESPRVSGPASLTLRPKAVASSPSPEKRKQTPTEILESIDAIVAEDRSPAEESGCDKGMAEDSRVEYHSSDNALAYAQPTFESFTVNTELEGSKQLSQMELNMLVRNSIIKARRQTRAIQESTSIGRKTTPKPKQSLSGSAESEMRRRKTESYNEQVAVAAVTQAVEDDEEKVVAEADKRKCNNDAVSVADTEPSQLTEPSALRRISDEMGGKSRGSGNNYKLTAYLDSEEDVHEDVLRNARRMLRGMTEANDPIETIRNADPLSPIADDEATFASKETKRHFFPETPISIKQLDESRSRKSDKSRTDTSREESQNKKADAHVLADKPAALPANSPSHETPIELFPKDESPSKLSTKSKSSTSRDSKQSATSFKSRHLTSSRKNKRTSKDETLQNDTSATVWLDNDRTKLNDADNDKTLESPPFEIETMTVKDSSKSADGVEVTQDEVAHFHMNSDTRAAQTSPAIVAATQEKQHTQRSRSVSRGKERLAQFYQRSKPKKQIAPWTADPAKVEQRSDPEENNSIARDIPTLEPATKEPCTTEKIMTRMEGQKERRDPEEESLPGWTKTGRRIIPKCDPEPSTNLESDSNVPHLPMDAGEEVTVKPFSDNEIENIVHISMDKAQKTARDEIQELLQESKRHENKIGVKTTDGYKLFSQDEIAGLVKESMRKAREAAQHEIADLVRESMQQARESAQAELSELVKDSMRRARESALKEMSDIVKESLRAARADDSTVVSMSAFTLNSVPTYRQIQDPIPVVPADAVNRRQSYLLPGLPFNKHEPDTIPEEVMSGSVFEGVASDEWKESGRADALCLDDEAALFRNDVMLDSKSLCKVSSRISDKSEDVHLPAFLESTLVLHGTEVQIQQGPNADSASDSEQAELHDKYEVTAVVHRKQGIQGTNLCFGYSAHSVSSAISSCNEEVSLARYESNLAAGDIKMASHDRVESDPIVALTSNEPVIQEKVTGGSYFCGGSAPSYDDEPRVEEITFVSTKMGSHGTQLASGRWKNTIEPEKATSVARKLAAKAESQRDNEYEKDAVPLDNLAPLSPINWIHHRKKAGDDRQSTSSRYSLSDSRQKEGPHKRESRRVKEVKETVMVTDELLAQMAALKGATVTQKELSKLLSRPRERKESRSSRPTNKDVKNSSARPKAEELEVAESRFCVNFMDLLSVDEDDGYTKAGSHSLASSLHMTRNNHWRGDIDLEGTFTATDNEYSIGQSFSPNEYSTFSDDD